MIRRDAASDDDGSEAETGRLPFSVDPVDDDCVMWLLNDILAVDAGEDLLGGGVGILEPGESELARAVDAVELPEDVMKMARLVPPPTPAVRLSRALPRLRQQRSRASGRDIEGE